MSLSRRVARFGWRTRSLVLLALTAGVVTVALTTGSAGSDSTPTHPLRADQTEGYGNDRLLGFTYGQNFSCIHRPGDDLDHNGVPADLDPAEFQAPHCTAGIQPPIDPTGDPIGETEPLYVIVPFFDGDNDGEAADGLAPTLKMLPIMGRWKSASTRITLRSAVASVIARLTAVMVLPSRGDALVTRIDRG